MADISSFTPTSARGLAHNRRSDHRISRVEKELEADERRYRTLLDQYEGLRAEVEELNEAIQRRRRLLDVLRESAPNTRNDQPPMTKPQIAERILWASLEPMFPRQVRDLAVEKGWLSDDAASRNQLAVAMSKMARKGRLVRGSDGRYSVPGRG
jgi:hypothetical protein